MMMSPDPAMFMRSALLRAALVLLPVGAVTMIPLSAVAVQTVADVLTEGVMRRYAQNLAQAMPADRADSGSRLFVRKGRGAMLSDPTIDWDRFKSLKTGGRIYLSSPKRLNEVVTLKVAVFDDELRRLEQEDGYVGLRAWVADQCALAARHFTGLSTDDTMTLHRYGQVLQDRSRNRTQDKTSDKYRRYQHLTQMKIGLEDEMRRRNLNWEIYEFAQRRALEGGEELVDAYGVALSTVAQRLRR